MNDASAEAQDYNALADDEFRALARRFVEEHYPPELRNPLRRLHWRDNRPWYMILAEHGWLAPGWPREHAGRGPSAPKHLILIEEFDRPGGRAGTDRAATRTGRLLIGYGPGRRRGSVL